MDIKQLIDEVKKGKKYSNLSDEIIKSEIEKFEKRNPRWREFKLAFVAKQIKRELHKAHGSFQTYKKGKIESFLEKQNFDSILRTNLSTKERIENYPEIYKQLFEITGNPRSILDIGCGFNPISIIYSGLNLQEIEYYAYDINEEDMRIVNEFFKIAKIKGKAGIFNAKKPENINKLENADVCFLFKVLDPLEKSEAGHRLSEKIILSLLNKCRFIIASFATKTLSGKMMNCPYRGWVEKMLTRLNLKTQVIEFENELFYIISER